MVQGGGKLGKAKKSGGSRKRSERTKSLVKKGRKTFNAKGSKKNAALRAERVVSKAINRKNESLVAAKAVSAGKKFFLKDIAEVGKKELNKQIRERNKKQDKTNNMSDRLKSQLQTLEGQGG